MSLDKCQKYENLSIEEVLDKLSLLYTNAIDSLRDAIAIYVKDSAYLKMLNGKMVYLPTQSYA